MVGTMLAFSTYAIGYLSRPLGGLFFGRLGDKIGRRAVLVITLIIMGLTTATIGLLPTYGSAGILAPLLLITLRFVQGVALGGEWAGAVLLAVEHGRQDQRGLNASWTQMGPALGTLLGTGLIYGFTSLMDNETFLAWGWRVPFLLSLALVTFGLWVRSGVEESPMFKQLEEAHTKAKAPIKEVVTNHWRRLLLAGGSRIGGDVLYGLVVVFTLTYVTTVLQLPKSRP
jgi:MFS family permease